MKKTILILAILALLAPSAALAATEFSLGGFIKLDTIWDSSTVNKNLVGKDYRDNDPINQHGRFRETANGTRFNFTMKGPKLWGAQVTGFIECDFDSAGATTPPTGSETADSGNFRLRHAMFRLNWPETQLLFGQYWSFFSEWAPEMPQDGALQYRGANVYRPAQISLTQKFLDGFTFGAMLATPRQTQTDPNVGASGISQDERAETPHVEAKLSYEKDLWGKAAYWGKPRGFVAQVNGAWQRTNIAATNAFAAQTFGQNNYNDNLIAATPNIYANHQYLNHWAIQGSMFVPVIPTHSANLAGTANILTQWAVGQGQGFVVGSWLTDDSFYKIKQVIGNNNYVADRVLTSSFTGFVQAQYYFNNEWFLNAAWGTYHAFGVGFDRLWAGGPFIYASNPNAQANAGNNDLTKYSNLLQLAVWYRPIEAIKFGLTYAYTHDVYFQKASYTAAGALANGVANPNTSRDTADNHRVEFVGFYYF